MIRRSIILFLMALAITLSVVTPVLATDDPDSTPSVINTWVYRNLLETGDGLFLWEANIPYATSPDELVTEAYIWQLIDTDNVTELGNTIGYAYNASGYGYNVYSLYFSAADNPTWGQTYSLRLVQNPSVFPSPKLWNFPISTSSYTSLTDSTDNQNALASRILLLAGGLDARWGLTSAYSLLLESEAGTFLSIFGESVFRGAIYGVQALAPGAFRILLGTISAPDRTWTDAYSANLTQQFVGTWIQESKDAGGTLFGAGYDLASIIIAISLIFGVIYSNYILGAESWVGFIDVALLLVMLPRLDMIPLSFTALMCALAVIGLGKPVKEWL